MSATETATAAASAPAAKAKPSQESSSFVGLPVIPPNDASLTKDPSTYIPRHVLKVFEAREQAEGAGARVRRSIGTPSLRNLSPFLMLDHFVVGQNAGFPDHPHRGQETVTYMLSGAVDHEDFAGNAGTIYAGDLQFMTAGRGIMHAEMPRSGPGNDPPEGLQLWVDLPQHLKACEPRYRDLRSAEIPRASADAGRVAVKVISGRAFGVDSPKELAYTPVWLLDFTVAPGGAARVALPAGWTAFAYVLPGAPVFLDSTKVPEYHNAVLSRDGDAVGVKVADDAGAGARFVLVAGLPLDQEIVQHGPFVVTSKQEVYKAMMDFSTFSNGFERGDGWESEIGKRV